MVLKKKVHKLFQEFIFKQHFKLVDFDDPRILRKSILNNDFPVYHNKNESCEYLEMI